uniref:Presenilinlike protein putative n=1 Tax=Albugo laibachii Nc14 TaxID=890382 RepID=F0VZ14_9STRA|nr:presenilinlike protein putative [Albugo laibachii Nc14]|eukprot:CCA14029.1 presenilinlike protein putative [Albugo laibachii Nc14]
MRNSVDYHVEAGSNAIGNGDSISSISTTYDTWNTPSNQDGSSKRSISRTTKEEYPLCMNGSVEMNTRPGYCAHHEQIADEYEAEKKSQFGEEAAANDDLSKDLMHGINSFWAIILPITITITIASIVVVNFRNEDMKESMKSYLVYGDAEQNSGSSVFGRSLINAVVLISAIAILTFGMVLLYKYNCIKFLAGYIMFAVVSILSFVGGQLMDTIIQVQIGWIVDWPSFTFIMVNLGLVGVVAIFYQKGLPKLIQGAYLVLSSVILAWQFSMWPEWTTWIFCFSFACYDLCAVLTPCGPLKCLINLIQDKQTPLPGLLYEADVSDRVRESLTEPPVDDGQSRLSVNPARNPTRSHSHSSSQAKRPPLTVEESDFSPYHCDTMEDLVQLLKLFYQTFSARDLWKVDQVAEKCFESQDRLWMLIYHKYNVCSCVVGTLCPVQERAEAKKRSENEMLDDQEANTIKLGLGDFIFYSVLVGRAAIYDFSTFVVCFLCVLLGLGGTLFLLSVLHKALPALPISIFLAIMVYFWTRYVFVDYGDFLLMHGILM